MNRSRRPAPTGSARVRLGYLSAEERRALAELFDTVEHCLNDIEPVPAMIRTAWGEADELLGRPRGELR